MMSFWRFVCSGKMKSMSSHPDGGYGWIALFGINIINLSVLPLPQCFGIIFEEKFQTLGITAAQISLILHLNSFIMCSLGLFSGPIFRRFNFRQVSMAGCAIVSIAICLTSCASTFVQFVITYCFVLGFGQGILYPATSIALNTYFCKRRSIAMGIAVTVSGIGPTFTPYISNKLLEIFGTFGTVLILGAVAMNSLIGALLLRPITIRTECIDKIIGVVDENKTGETTQNKISNGLSSVNLDLIENKTKYDIQESINNNRNDRTFAKLHFSSEKTNKNNTPINHEELIPLKRRNSTENFTKTKDENDSNNVRFCKSNDNIVNNTNFNYNFSSKNNVENEKNSIEFPKSSNNINVIKIEAQNIEDRNDKTARRNIFIKISNALNLELLDDWVFVSIVIGMSISFVSELNFNLMFPFVLSELAGFDRNSIAHTMSIQAFADITARMVIPLGAQKFGWDSRVLYTLSLLVTCFGRTVLTKYTDSSPLILCAAGLIGTAKGVKAVFQALIVPNYVPLDKLPAANGLLLVTNGVLSLALGPLIGLIHDATDGYATSLYVTSAMSLFCVILWIAELLLCKVGNVDDVNL